MPPRLRPPPPDRLSEDPPPSPPSKDVLPEKRPPPPPPDPDPPRREVLLERSRPPRRPPPAPSPPPPVSPARDLPPLGEVTITFVRRGTEGDEIGWDEVDVNERVGLEKDEDDDAKEEGEEINLGFEGEEEEEEEETGNEENVFVTTGADDDTMVGDRKDDDDGGKDDDCKNVVVRVEGEENEVAGDRLAKILAPQRGDTDSPATARRVTK